MRKYGYPVELHSVETSDGYILGMHRIPYGRDVNSGGVRPAVFLMHGLLSSTADWILMGPGKGFGYILADAGYDVWFGNARGNYYSRNHTSKNPDDTSFWQFSWHEIGHIDLADMIDYVLDKTGQSSLHYIGHSQGTTSFFVLASTRPEYNSKIRTMQAFAPVAFMENVGTELFHTLAPYSSSLDKALKFLGMSEILPNNHLMTIAGQKLCSDEAVFKPLCTSLVFLILGYNTNQLNTTMFPVIMGHSPAGASAKQLVHYAQGINVHEFRQFDFGKIRNLIRYGSFSPPDYRLDLITAPVALHYSDNDAAAHVDDVDRLFRSLKQPLGKFRVPFTDFNHVDFIWAIDAKTLLYDRVINLMRTFD